MSVSMRWWMAPAGLALAAAAWWASGGSHAPEGGGGRAMMQAAGRLALAPAAAGDASRTVQKSEAQPAGPEAMGGENVPAASAAPVPAARLAVSQAPGPDRLLIRNAALSVEVRDARDAARRVSAAVVAMRGYVGNLAESVDPLGARTISMQVRAPYDRFEAVAGALRDLGKLQSMQITADDVTEEFTDAQSRLRNLRRTEARLLDHLSSSRRLQDTLAVEREVTRVREEIEQIEGRLRFLQHRIAFCTFAVTLVEAPRQQALVPPDTYSSGKIVGEATRSLVAFAQSVWGLVIWLAVWSAVWAPAAVVAALVRRSRVRRAPGAGA